jgi:predicted aldo/keto reductase-like oxidoreductase
VGIVGMKGLGGYRAAIVHEGGIPAATAYRYALSQPVATQVSGMSSLDELRANLALARDFVPMSAREQAEIVAAARGAAVQGSCEPFKSTTEFEGPHHKRQHGEAA